MITSELYLKRPSKGLQINRDVQSIPSIIQGTEKRISMVSCGMAGEIDKGDIKESLESHG